MFEFGKGTTVDEAISGLYYAIRLIRHRHDLVDLETGIQVAGLESEPSLAEQAIAVRIVEEILAAEELSLSGTR